MPYFVMARENPLAASGLIRFGVSVLNLQQGKRDAGSIRANVHVILVDDRNLEISVKIS
jgi:hypothetical protein